MQSLVALLQCILSLFLLNEHDDDDDDDDGLRGMKAYSGIGTHIHTDKSSIIVKITARSTTK